jgi:hypothetical protein
MINCAECNGYSVNYYMYLLVLSITYIHQLFFSKNGYNNNTIYYVLVLCCILL